MSGTSSEVKFPSLLLSAVVLAAACAPASILAQSNPFAGSWSGSTTSSSTESCAGSVSFCSITQPWTGTIDSQGNFTVAIGNGSISCDDGTTLPISASAPALFGQVSSGGALTVPVYQFSDTTSGVTTTQTCPAWTLQFTSGGKVSGANSCTFSTSGLGLSCSGSSMESFQGSGAVPIFPITVTSNITKTTATASAQIQPRPQDVGTTASVFVFAWAPASGVIGAKRGASGPLIRQQDGPAPDPCVLAQLNSNGQLVAASSASSLSAYTTGVLSSQSQAVSILNNVSTPNVAGASFLVGYGASSNAMISNGVYQGAVSVTGDSTCNTSLLSGAAPNSPSALSGLWWNPSESGWGISFTQRRNDVFAAWYTYDASGNPIWYVAPTCTLPSGVTGSTGICSGSLYSVNGPTFFGTTFNPAAVQVNAVGLLTVNFQNASTASMNYTVNGQSRTVPIVRQVFSSGTAPLAVDYTDLWWNPNESGWGMVITQEYGVMFLAWYVYDSNGKPLWYVAPDCVVNASSCNGSLYRTTGPPFGPTFNPASINVFPVGTISATFGDANNATISYTVNGTPATKIITRQVF